MEHYYVESKKCPRCGETKGRDEFHKDSSRKDGLQAICAECSRKKRREQSRKNAAQIEYPYIEFRVCSTCQEKKHRSEFGKDRYDKYGIRCICLSCTRIRNRKNYVKYDRPGEEDSRSRLYKATVNGRLVSLLGNAKRRAKLKGLDYDLDLQWLLNLYQIQNGSCVLTGLPFSFEFNKEFKRQFMPFSPSLDRIDSSKGYTKENTRLVCTAINIAMNHYGEKTFAEVATAYLQRVKR
jgi:hypothetical protein